MAEMGIGRILSFLTDKVLVRWRNPGDTADMGTLADPVRVDPTGITSQPVTMSSIMPGTGATNLGKAEDAPHTSGDVGVMLLGVRRDVPSPMAADNDYHPLTIDQSGALTLPFGAANSAEQANQTAALQLIDNIVHLTGDAPINGFASVGGQLDDVDTETPAENQVGAARITSGRAFHVNLRGASGAEAGTAGNPIRIEPTGTTPQSVSGTVAVSSVTTSITPGTAALNLGKPEDGVHASGDVGVMALAVRNDAGTAFAADGDYVPLSVDSTGALRTSGAGATTQYDEDTPHVTGDKVTLAGVVQQSADAALSSDGDRSVLQVDATGFVKVTVKASSLPSGAATLAEQQTQTASLSIIDDWDESDRAKVNPIVGQAGVQGGSGVVTALTQRVVQATDVPVTTRGAVTTTGTVSGVTVSTTAVVIKASNANRKFIAITNNGTANVYLGTNSSVTASGAEMGLLLAPGGAMLDDGSIFGTGDVYGITSVVIGSQNVAVIERT